MKNNNLEHKFNVFVKKEQGGKAKKDKHKQDKKTSTTESKIIVKGKKAIYTNCPCSVSSEGSDLTKDFKIKKKKEYTCYSHESLIKIADAYSKQHPNDPIKTEGLTKVKLWNILRNKLSGICGYDEYCWRKQDFVKRLKDANIELYTFKPKFPEEWKKNKYTWLNTYDILFVMKQYEKMRDDFIFMGVVPSDCPTKITCELSNIDVHKLRSAGINKAGIIFNTDTSDGPGQHWVGVFSEFNDKKAQINFYDSYGEKPQPLIYKFLKQLAQKFEKNKIEAVIIYNDRRHQYGGSECSVFSMNFILERLNGTTMYDISKMKILDKDMNYLRQILYVMK